MAVKWSTWASLGKPADKEIGRPFVQRNQDGRLEVFAIGQGEMFNISQVLPNGAWRSDWRSKGRPSAQVGIRSHVVGRNADGRLEVFAVGEDDAVWQKWQAAPNNGWTDAWATLSGPTSEQFPFSDRVLEQLAVGRNQDGRQWPPGGLRPRQWSVLQSMAGAAAEHSRHQVAARGLERQAKTKA